MSSSSIKKNQTNKKATNKKKKTALRILLKHAKMAS